MKDYCLDPDEIEFARAEAMLERVFDNNKPRQFFCAGCDRWRHEGDGMNPSSPDPACYPICGDCFWRER